MSKASERALADAFFALGDAIRISIVNRLGAEGAMSATVLSDGALVTRQAIVKHLQVLERAGLAHHQRRGRQVLYALEADGLDRARTYLEAVSARWDRAIARLRDLVEKPARRRRPASKPGRGRSPRRTRRRAPATPARWRPGRT
jgi:DNA-binding transcriptional ArsR family regulator